jgi:hypothetical protein
MASAAAAAAAVAAATTRANADGLLDEVEVPSTLSS